LRVHQCREGWHLDEEPDLTPDDPNAVQIELTIDRPTSPPTTTPQPTCCGTTDNSSSATLATALTRAQMTRDSEADHCTVKHVLNPPP
jgi:hypothetical protein